MELNDDLMNQILIRLPVKSIFRFKCVSKPWNCFLSSAYFRREYISFRNKPWIASSSSSSPSSLLGFFQFHSSTTRTDNAAADANNNDNRPREEELVEKFSFLPTNSEEQGEGGGGLLPLPIVSDDDFREKLGFFYCSHGGLIVCGHHPSTYYVCNPVTNQWVSLPKLDCLMDKDERGVRYTVAIYCKEKEKHGYFRHSYKVVRPFFIPRSYSKTVSIAMYSSKTGLWKKYIAKAANNFQLLSNEVCPCIIIQETIIWIARPFYFAAYNPKNSKDHILLITFPLALANSRLSTLGVSVDGLLHCVVDDATPGFKIFVLKDKLSSYGYSECLVDDEWVLRHTVSLDIPGMVWDNRSPRPRIHNRTAIPGLYHENLPRRIALHPQNPLLLYLRVGQSFFSCDLATGTINIVPHEGNLLPWETRYKLLPYFQLVWPLSP